MYRMMAITSPSGRERVTLAKGRTKRAAKAALYLIRTVKQIIFFNMLTELWSQNETKAKCINSNGLSGCV